MEKKRFLTQWWGRIITATLAIILVCCLWTLPAQAEDNGGVEGFVTRLYNICLDRDPDPSGFNAWVDQLKSGANTGAEVAYGFIFSNEFKSKNPCNTDYIASLYRCFLGREPDSAGMSAWLARIDAGDSRGTIFNGFVGSDEFTKICQSYGINRGNGDWSNSTFVLTGDCQICGAKNKTVSDFVTRLYNVCLDRNPDANGLNSWINTIINGQSGAQTAYGFIFSKEFKEKNLCNEDFVEYMYKAFFGRASDASGKAGWVNVLNNGGTKGHVFSGFTGSDEFKKLCAQYGISAGIEDYSAIDFKSSGTCVICEQSANTTTQNPETELPSTEPETQPQQPETELPSIEEYKQKYDYKLFIVNTYKTLYTGCSVFMYVKTDNPDPLGFAITWETESGYEFANKSEVLDDINPNVGSDITKVEGGYLLDFYFSEPRQYKAKLVEIKEGHYFDYGQDRAFGRYNPELYCSVDDVSMTITLEDSDEYFVSWMNNLVDTYTTPQMSPQEKFYAVCDGGFSNFIYEEVVMVNGEYERVTTVKNYGTPWQNHRIDSYLAPRYMVYIGELVGYDVQPFTTWELHAFVKTPDGDIYTICPPTETGDIGEVVPFDFSKFQ